MGDTCNLHSRAHNLQAGADLWLQGLAHVEHSAAVPGSQLKVAGALHLNQRRAVQQGARHWSYLQPVLFSANSSQPYQLVRALCAKRRFESQILLGIWVTAEVDWSDTVLRIQTSASHKVHACCGWKRLSSRVWHLIWFNPRRRHVCSIAACTEAGECMQQLFTLQ